VHGALNLGFLSGAVGVPFYPKFLKPGDEVQTCLSSDP
jgi:hypothetical protein